MGCHGMSCAGFVCCGRAGPAAVVSVRCPGYSVGFFRLPVSGIGLSFRSVFAPFPRRPAVRRGGRTMSRAIARGRAGALAPARFARLIAPVCPRARTRTQGAPFLSAPSVVFRVGAGAGGSGLRKPLPVICSGFILTYFGETQVLRRHFSRILGLIYQFTRTASPRLLPRAMNWWQASGVAVCRTPGVHRPAKADVDGPPSPRHEHFH